MFRTFLCTLLLFATPGAADDALLRLAGKIRVTAGAEVVLYNIAASRRMAEQRFGDLDDQDLFVATFGRSAALTTPDLSRIIAFGTNDPTYGIDLLEAETIANWDLAPEPNAAVEFGTEITGLERTLREEGFTPTVGFSGEFLSLGEDGALDFERMQEQSNVWAPIGQSIRFAIRGSVLHFSTIDGDMMLQLGVTPLLSSEVPVRDSLEAATAQHDLGALIQAYIIRGPVVRTDLSGGVLMTDLQGRQDQLGSSDELPHVPAYSNLSLFEWRSGETTAAALSLRFPERAKATEASEILDQLLDALSPTMDDSSFRQLFAERSSSSEHRIIETESGFVLLIIFHADIAPDARPHDMASLAFGYLLQLHATRDLSFLVGR